MFNLDSFPIIPAFPVSAKPLTEHCKQPHMMYSSTRVRRQGLVEVHVQWPLTRFQCLELEALLFWTAKDRIFFYFFFF